MSEAATGYRQSSTPPRDATRRNGFNDGICTATPECVGTRHKLFDDFLNSRKPDPPDTLLYPRSGEAIVSPALQSS